uniref:Zgc:152863 n=1 Tax=Scleropages formosus TaxID=113540 RepID=A0A8C9SZ92_SCLFO
MWAEPRRSSPPGKGLRPNPQQLAYATGRQQRSALRTPLHPPITRTYRPILHPPSSPRSAPTQQVVDLIPTAALRRSQGARSHPCEPRYSILMPLIPGATKHLRKPLFMSPCGPSLWKFMPSSLGCVILIVFILPDLASAKNCSHPVIPEHGGFRCEPSPCRGYPHKTTIHYFCEPGFYIPGRPHNSRCLHGIWTPNVPTCIPNPNTNINAEDGDIQPLPSVATTAIGVSIFLLTTTACMVIKSRLYPCHSHSRRSSDQMDLMVDGLPISLPTYEEAVYGSWGQRLPPCRGPTQLLLAQENSGQTQALAGAKSTSSSTAVCLCLLSFSMPLKDVSTSSSRALYR